MVQRVVRGMGCDVLALIFYTYGTHSSSNSNTGKSSGLYRLEMDTKRSKFKVRVPKQPAKQTIRVESLCIFRSSQCQVSNTY